LLKNLIVLPDKTEIFSGIGTVNAIKNVTLTQSVNAGKELTLGSACSNMLEATLFTPGGGLHIAEGTELTLYKVDDNGNRTKVGLFTVEESIRPSQNLCKLTAYDRVSWLDRDLTQWLESLNGWPYTLHNFAQMVCAACNLTLINASLPNGAWKIQKFSAKGITGRKLMRWVGEARGWFCRATTEGEIEFAWYAPKNVSISPEGTHYINDLRCAGYWVAPVDKVQIRMTESDVGGIYGTSNNAYVITGNRLLASDTVEPLQTVAQVLYNALQGVRYTPCRVKIPATTEIMAGDIVQLTDKNGNTFPLYVMTKVQTSQQDTLECGGSPRRGSSTVTNNSQLIALNGKILGLEMSMEGLRIENRDRDEKVAVLELTEDGLTTSVADKSTQLDSVTNRVSTMEQTAAGLSLQVQNIQNDGANKVSTSTGYIFDETGMTVEKSGREIKTQITEDGMTVYKNEVAVLTVNSQGVDAVDLHASTYLIVGGRSRFENYGENRTGCFWIGG